MVRQQNVDDFIFFESGEEDESFGLMLLQVMIAAELASSKCVIRTRRVTGDDHQQRLTEDC
jgi:hypothetical protein